MTPEQIVAAVGGAFLGVTALATLFRSGRKILRRMLDTSDAILGTDTIPPLHERLESIDWQQAKLEKRLNAGEVLLHEIKEQVANEHSTNLRHDIDAIGAEMRSRFDKAEERAQHHATQRDEQVGRIAARVDELYEHASREAS